MILSQDRSPSQQANIVPNRSTYGSCFAGWCFAVALYPGHLAIRDKNFVLNPDIQVTSRTPPTFLLQTEDDPVENSLVYYSALKKMHVYVKCGHAFGLRPTESPITRGRSLWRRGSRRSA